MSSGGPCGNELYVKGSRRLRKTRHTLPSVIVFRRCASAFSTELLFATSITQVHLGRLRRRRECQTHHLSSFRNKWRAPNLVGARLVPLPERLRRSAQAFAFFFSFPKIDVRDPYQPRRCLYLREWIWSVKQSLLLRGAGRWNGMVKPAASLLITAANMKCWRTRTKAWSDWKTIWRSILGFDNRFIDQSNVKQGGFMTRLI